MNNLKKLEKEIRNLFKDTYLANCKLENIQTSVSEATEASKDDIFNVISNLRLIITSLLSFKQSSILDDKSELIQRNEQFENMLQKLEADIRNHIRVENQLKLHIESNQVQTAKIETEKNKEIKTLNEQLKSFNTEKTSSKESEYLEKIEILENSLAKKDKIIYKLEIDFVKLKTMIEANERRPKKAEKFEKKKKFEDLKDKIEQKKLGLQRIQTLLKQNSVPKVKDRSRSSKKPRNEVESYKTKSPKDKLISNLIQSTHVRSISEKVRYNSIERRTASQSIHDKIV